MDFRKRRAPRAYNPYRYREGPNAPKAKAFAAIEDADRRLARGVISRPMRDALVAKARATLGLKDEPDGDGIDDPRAGGRDPPDLP